MHGAKIVCADIRDEMVGIDGDEGEELDTHIYIQQNGGDSIFVKTDVSQNDHVEALIARTVEAYERLDM